MRVRIDPDIARQNFDRVKDSPALQESAQLFARGVPVAEMLQAMSMSECVLRAFAGLDSVYPHGKLERGVTEKIILCVSKLHECQFCENAHIDMMAGLGMAPDVSTEGAHTDRERLAIEWATAMTKDSNRIPDELASRMRERFTDAEIVEVTFMVGLITLLNRFNNALEVRYQGEFKDVTIGR
jgi:alkylhydroperoxidase family enzyme